MTGKAAPDKNIVSDVTKEFETANDWTKLYVENALRTKSDNYFPATDDAKNIALLSVMNELKELEPTIDGLKRACFYGNDLPEYLLHGVVQLVDYYETVENSDNDEAKAQLVQVDEQLARMKKVDPDLIHGILGVFSEACELVLALMKNVENDEQVDIVNLREELGDIHWYMAILTNAMGTSYANSCIKNIAKLRQRFPDKFTKDKSDNRDLGTERGILEDATDTEQKLVFK